MNFLSIKHYKKINIISVNNNLGDLENTISYKSSKIDTNKNSIKDNDADIAYNLREINKIKNTKTYLKNLFNILFYDSKLKLILKEYFLKKYLKLMQNKMIL